MVQVCLAGWVRPSLGRRKRADGDRLTEKGWVWAGSVASGRIDGRAGLMVRAERQRQALEAGERERTRGAYTHVYDEEGGEKKIG
jgi:hypothetical protein